MTATIEFKATFNCEAYFYFGISNIQDCVAIENILNNFCKRFFNVWPVKSLSNDFIFCSIVEIIEIYQLKHVPNVVQDEVTTQKQKFYHFSDTNCLKRRTRKYLMKQLNLIELDYILSIFVLELKH